MKTKLYTLILAIMTILSIYGLLNKTGALAFIWQSDEPSAIRHDAGHAYIAFQTNTDSVGIGWRSLLSEDGYVRKPAPLSVNEDITRTVKEFGRGAFVQSEDGNLYFSLSDNHEPDEHELRIITPKILRLRQLFPLWGLTGLLWLIFIVLYFKKILTVEHLKRVLRIVFGGFLLLYLLPWSESIFPEILLQRGFIPVFRRTVPIYLLTAVGLMLIDRKPLLTFFSICLLLNTVYTLIPEWNYFGTRADTIEYLEKHTASSLRTPGYPNFVETVLKTTGKENLKYWRGEDGEIELEICENRLRNDESHGLLRVARIQKVLSASAFLLAVLIFAIFTDNSVIFLAGEVILCGGFLGVYSSYIMSETLSQAMVLLVCTFFTAHLLLKNEIFYLPMAACCALAIIIRPANIFLLLPLFIGTVAVLRSDFEHRGWVVLLCGMLFLSIVSVPCREIAKEYGKFLWMPDSGYVEIARALALADEKDAHACNGECAEFLTGALAKKNALIEERGMLTQNELMWDVAIPQAEEMGCDHIEASWLFAKVYPSVFKNHFVKFLCNLMDSLMLAFERTRLQMPPVRYWMFVALVIVLSFFRISTLSFCGLVLVLLHNAHLAISIINQPERRYIFSTEILFIIGATLIIANLIRPGTRNESLD